MIPVIIAYNYLVTMVSRMVLEMETYSSSVITVLEDGDSSPARNSKWGKL